MKAIILAAGRGSRMGNITDEKPKCLTILFGKPLIELEIDAIKKSGIEEIALVTGYMSEKINISGVHYFNNPNWKYTNMVKSLYYADDWLNKNDCIISYSDIVYESKAIEMLKNCNQDIGVLYNTNWLNLWKMRFENPLDDAETFKIDNESKIIEIGKKTNNINEIEGQYMGLLKIKPNGWDIIKTYISSLAEDIINKLDITTLLSNLVHFGTSIYAIPYDSLWLEIDNQDDLKLYEQEYKYNYLKKER